MRATCLAAGGRLLSGGSVADHQRRPQHRERSACSSSTTTSTTSSRAISPAAAARARRRRRMSKPTSASSPATWTSSQLNHHGSTTTSNQVYLSTREGRGRGRSDRHDEHVRPSESRDGQQVPEHAGHERQRVRRHRRTRGRRRPGLLSARREPAERRSRDASGLLRAHRPQLPAAARSCSRPTARTDLLAHELRRRRRAASTRASHTYPVDGVSPGVTTDFPPTVIAQTDARRAARHRRRRRVGARQRSRIADHAVSCSATRSTAWRNRRCAMTLVGERVSGARFRRSPTARASTSRSRARPAVQTTTFMRAATSPASTPVVDPARAERARRAALRGYAARIQGTVVAAAATPSAPAPTTTTSRTPPAASTSFDRPTRPRRSRPRRPDRRWKSSGASASIGGRLPARHHRVAREDRRRRTASARSSSGPAPAPAPVTIAALNANPESYEGQLVSIANAHDRERHAAASRRSRSTRS